MKTRKGKKPQNEAKDQNRQCSPLSDKALGLVVGGVGVKPIDTALQATPDWEATEGGTRNRFDYTSSGLTASSEATTPSESPFRDSDMAKD